MMGPNKAEAKEKEIVYFVSDVWLKAMEQR
jgi:hypothetical protein